MMSIIDRINKWVIARQNRLKKPKISFIKIMEDKIFIRSNGEDKVLSWDDIDKVVAARVDNFVGDTMVLLWELRDGSTFLIAEGTDNWRKAIGLMPLMLSGAKRYEDWAVKLVASPPEASVDVYKRKPSSL